MFQWILATELLHYVFARRTGAIDRLAPFPKLSEDLVDFAFPHAPDDVDEMMETAFELSRKLALVDSLSAVLSEAYVLHRVIEMPQVILQRTIEPITTGGMTWRLRIPVASLAGNLQREYIEAMRKSTWKVHRDAHHVLMKIMKTESTGAEKVEGILFKAASQDVTRVDLLDITYDSIQTLVRTTNVKPPCAWGVNAHGGFSKGSLPVIALSILSGSLFTKIRTPSHLSVPNNNLQKDV